MKINYVGRNVQIRDNFKEQVDKKLGRLDKYFQDDVEATATFSVQGNFKTVEVTIWLDSGTILRAEDTSDDMLTAVDMAVNSLDSQIRKYKTKLQRRNTHESIRFDFIPDDLEAIEEKDGPNIARIKKIGLKPMYVEEAVLQMELLRHDFFVFLNADTDLVSVVYKRKQGDFGLIEPSL